MATIQQWINIDLSHANAARHRQIPAAATIPEARCGTEITLRVRLSGGGHKRGKRVFWAVQLGANNLGGIDAGNTGSGWAVQAAAGGFAAPGFYEKLVPANDRGESITTFVLSGVGGDEFTIKAYTKGRGGGVKKELQSDTYVVWKQLFYQVTQMGPLVGRISDGTIPNMAWGSILPEFADGRKPHNIRFSEQPPTAGIITRVRNLGADADQLNTGREGYDRSKEPLVTKISLCDILSGPVEDRHTFDVVKAGASYSYEFDTPLYDNNSAHDRDDWFRYVQAKRTDDPGTAVTIGRNNLRRAGPSTVRVTMPDIPSDGIFDWCPRAKVKVGVYLHDTPPNGFSWYNGIWMTHNQLVGGAAGWGGDTSGEAHFQPRADAEKNKTMIHEIGHAIGMVNGASPYWYPTSHGHQGPHCWFGATDPSTLPSANASFPSTPKAQCVMFGDSSREKGVFCDTCVDFVRKTDPSTDGKYNDGAMIPP